MMEMVLHSFIQGFVIALVFYFTGIVLPLIQTMARWK
jgi:hypothetical protein